MERLHPLPGPGKKLNFRGFHLVYMEARPTGDFFLNIPRTARILPTVRGYLQTQRARTYIA